MKCVFVFVSCLLAAASAGYLGGSSYYTPHLGGANSYAFQSNGAGLGHAVAYNAPLVHGGYGAYGAPAYGAYGAPAYGAYGAPAYAHGGYAHGGYAHGGYYGANAPLVDPVAVAAGAPLPVGDTYEVAAAKAAHFAAHDAARARNHAAPGALGYGYAHAAPAAHYGYGGLDSEARLVDPVAIAAGAPLPTGDTYEVAAAKAAHLQAHAVARNGHLGW